MKSILASMHARALAVAALLCATHSFAQQLTLTHTGTGSGTLNGTPFTTTSFTITELIDTANRGSFSGGFDDVDSLASIAITGLGSFTFITPTRTFVNNSANIVGFARAGGSDLFDGPTDAAFTSWDMLTGIGPITGTGLVLQWSASPINTSGGILVFTNTPLGSPIPTTFTAVLTAIPEPSTDAALTGLLALGFAARRKKWQQKTAL
jgi:hypothetical protein